MMIKLGFQLVDEEFPNGFTGISIVSANFSDIPPARGGDRLLPLYCIQARYSIDLFFPYDRGMLREE